MKYLALVCDCGNRKLFEGEDVKSILDAIDQSGWQDIPSGGRKLPLGESLGHCPACVSLGNCPDCQEKDGN